MKSWLVSFFISILFLTMAQDMALEKQYPFCFFLCLCGGGCLIFSFVTSSYDEWT